MLRLARLLLAAMGIASVATVASATEALASAAPPPHHVLSARTAGTNGEFTSPTPSMTTKPTNRRATARVGTTNWSGYQVAVTGPLQAHASWYLPSVSWPGRDGYSSTWVGIGGGTAAQGQLIQAGTEQDVVCTAVRNGRCISTRAQYYAWIETYPRRGQERVTNLALAPGDAVEATVRWDPAASAASFTLCNWRTSQCVSAIRSAGAPRAVAQFVVERPTLGTGRVGALANFGAVTFTGLEVTNGRGRYAPGQLPTTRITMVNGRALATPGPLRGYGDSFSVSFVRPA